MRPRILIAADEADGVHWRVGYNNFYVITRYNHSAAVRHGGVRARRRGQAAGSRDRRAASRRCARRPAQGHERSARTRRSNSSRSAIVGLLSGCFSAPQRATSRAPAPAAPPPAPRRRSRASPERCPTRCRASSRARPTAIRRSTKSSASAITCCPRAPITSSAAWPPGTGRASTDTNLDPRALRHVRHDGRA